MSRLTHRPVRFGQRRTGQRRTQPRPLAALLSVATALLGLPSLAVAYDPPVDKAEGVTVRIEAPERVEAAGDTIDVAVIVENAGEAPLSAHLRIGLIDGWQADPGEFADVSVPAGETRRLTCRVQSAADSYAAHYPIHVRATVRRPDKPELKLHPIAVLVVDKAGGGGTRRAADWKPIVLAPDTAFALEQAAARRAVMQVFGKPVEVSEVGWSGSHPQHSGSLNRVDSMLGDVTKPCLGIHPPWRDGQSGTLAAEFPIQLPADTPATLDFSVGMNPEGQSDGVTFRVRVLPWDAPAGEWGEIVWERHTAAKTWEDHKVDLSKYAGKAVRLQLESHPGPKNNTGWDSCFWAAPTLVVGNPPQADPSPPAWDRAVTLGRGTVAGLDCEYRVVPGNRGLLDAAVGLVTPHQTVWFRGFQITVDSARLDASRSALALRSVEVQRPAAPGAPLKARHHFAGQDSEFDLVGELAATDGVLTASFRVENATEPQPWRHIHIEDAAVGPWSLPLERLFAGTGNVVVKPGRYRLGFDGHRLSTSFVGFEFTPQLCVIQACDVPPSHLDVIPAERHFSLHAAPDFRFTFIPAPDAWEGVKKWRDVNGLRPAGGVRQAAGRFVFDLWGGRYRDSADELRRAFRYGLTDSMVIWHNWQRWGYDYRLPEICPPNPQLGSLDDCRYLIESCREAGVLFALHDNYIDFYPDAEGFSYRERIAFHSNGTPVRAWLNEGRQAQSYRYRADQVEPFLQANLRWIRENLAPTAYFIDVWSSIGPYDYWTSDGRFFDRVFTRNTWGNHFAWIRQLLGNQAPQISESGHDQLIGWLDGAQTNHLRVGNPLPGYYQWSVWNWECQDAERVPWFDAAHHDRFVLHGAGYEGRYAAGLDTRLHGMYSDDYIATEVLTGHPAMVSRPFGEDVVRKYWLLSRLMRALALDRIESVEFVGGDIHRQHVRWQRGGEVWCNRGESDWEVQGTVLPQYGFLAKAPLAAAGDDSKPQVVEAAVARKDGIIVEYARSPEWLYVNGRKSYGGTLPVRPLPGEFRDLGERRLELQVNWQLRRNLPENYVLFAHFCDEEGAIVFQGGWEPRRPDGPIPGTVATVLRAAVPEQLEPGDAVELRIGAYDPRTGRRLTLAGPRDGEGRIRLGTLAVGEDAKLTWTAQSGSEDPVQARMNAPGKVIDFGDVATAQGVRINREGGGVRVTALPHAEDAVEAEIRLDRLWGGPVQGVR
ncbi:MAG: hypothetical protein GYA33_10575, partial [Thermogutta sp.]|nr:hypothetical protein [Thermogutta sp.]